MEQKQKKQKPTSQMNLLLRVLIGGYLLYLAYSLRGSIGDWPYLIAVIVFASAGVGILVLSIRRLILGEYDFVDRDGNAIEYDETDKEGSEENNSEK